MSKPSLTISVELNREAILHLLKYVGVIYMTEHTEDGTIYGLRECPYCLTLLTQLAKFRDDVMLQEKIQNMRIRYKRKKNKLINPDVKASVIVTR